RHDVGIGAKRGELRGAQARGESAKRGGVSEFARETQSALDVIGLRARLDAILEDNDVARGRIRCGDVAVRHDDRHEKRHEHEAPETHDFLPLVAEPALKASPFNASRGLRPVSRVVSVRKPYSD